MALQKSYTDDHGHVDSAAYCRVSYVVWLGTEAAIEVSIYKDVVARTGNLSPKRSLYRAKESDLNWGTTFALSKQQEAGMNIAKCAYVWVKDHADFVGATDV